MMSVKEALDIIYSNTRPCNVTENIDIFSSYSRILAQDIYSKDNIPPFNNSAMDGFAVIAMDTKKATKAYPKVLRIVADLAAGYSIKRRLKHNETVRIMTGAVLPYGADCVIKKEDVKEVSSKKKHGYIYVFKEVECTENIRYAGEDVKKGEKVLTAGAKIGPAETGMLAALGVSKIKVYKKPRVGIISTGDELAEIGDRLRPGKIRNSNSYSLYASILDCGALPLDFGVVSDKKEKIKNKIRQALKSCIDILLISGGVSVGEYDYVKGALADLGVKIKFWQVAMRPGKPLVFAALGKTMIFGLPGNPVSSLVCFEEFVRPAIMQRAGARENPHRNVYAESLQTIEKKKGLTYFFRVKLEEKNGKLFARLTGPQGSGILKSLVLADGIMVLPEELAVVKKGDIVKVQLL